MGKIIISTLISILPFTQLSHPHEEDPFTTYIQEKLIELGYLEVATGVNDKTSQAAIKLFQEKSGLIVDGMVGENTFLQLMLAENPTDNNSSATSSSAEDLVIDDKPPVWDEEQPPYASEIGTLFNLNMPSVSDNVGIVSYEVYVNGALSTYATISDSRLLITPKYDITCADQLIYVIAFDEAGNSSQSPSFTIPQTDPCISTSSSSSSSSSSQSYFAVSFGGTSGDQGRGIAVDSSGNSYITGYFEGTVDFGGGDVTSAGNPDIFVLKLDSSGASQWANTYGGTSTDRGYSIAVDSSGNSYITGYFEGTVDFGGGDITAGSNEIFVLKLNSSGTFQWVNTYGSTSSDAGNGIAVDSSGNAYITGFFQGTVDFGGGDVTSAGNMDIFVLKLNSSGTFQWVNTYGSTSDDRGWDIAVDSSGNSYITGSFQGTVDFGGGDVTSAGNTDFFVLKLNSSGTFQWANTYGGTSTDRGYGIAVDSSGNSYITGSFQGTVDFGGGDITATANSDIFVLKLNSSGTFQWVNTYGSTSNNLGLGIAVDSSGKFYTTGGFQGTIDFGGGDITATANSDIFVLNLNSSGQYRD